MRGQIGNWGSTERGGLAVGLSHEAVRWLEAQRTDRRVFVSVEKNREVIVLPDADGGRVTHCTEDRNTSPYRYISCTVPDSLFLAPGLDLPVFGLMEVEFDVEAGCLSASIPEADHELPWPKLDPDCTTYDAPMLLKECLQARLISLVASGCTTFRPEHRMPIRLRQMLPEGAWAECLATAKALAGVQHHD